jgi:hypothetical protein
LVEFSGGYLVTALVDISALEVLKLQDSVVVLGYTWVGVVLAEKRPLLIIVLSSPKCFSA